MPPIHRRHFLQFSGATLAAIGMSQFDFLHQANQYDRALAQPTGRKLALLIGINGYSAEIGPLNGCLNDIELQRQLLIHRYGFQPADIREVSDNTEIKPTRTNILKAFHEHLIQQAKPGDIVVVHYSGHGSRIKDLRSLDTAECRRVGDCELNGTIVPLDGTVVSRQRTELAVPDIMGRHLFLLLEAIQTDLVTVVLDCCHSGAGTRGNAEVRSARARASADQVLVPIPEEIADQEKLLAKLNLSTDEFQAQRQRGPAKGLVIGSARRDELAVDGTFDGFRAGAFTYLLTRYLWQQSTQHTAETVYINLQRSTERLAAQQQNQTVQVPIFDIAPNSHAQDKPLYFTPLTSPPAEAVITAIAPEIEYWLGGVSVQNLKGTGAGTIFDILDEQGQVVGKIEQTRRATGISNNGLRGYGKLIAGQPSAVKVDRLLREQIIGIPTNPKLKIGLDPSLGQDLLAARTALSTVSSVEAVEANAPMDYLLGRLTQNYAQQLAATDSTNLPTISTLGLFTPNLSALLPDTFGRIDEPIAAAINRLLPRFRSLLANQIINQLLETGQGSPLRVTASVIPINQQGQELPGQRLEFASRGAIESKTRPAVSLTPPQFRQDTLLKIKVENQETEDLYVGILIISSNGVMDVLYPVDWVSPEEAAQLTRTAVELTIPGPQADYTLTVEGTSGFPELLVLASREPLSNTLKALQRIAGSRGANRGEPLGLRGDEPLDVINSLLGDLTELTRSAGSNGGVRVARGQSVLYDKATMAVLSGIFEVIPK